MQDGIIAGNGNSRYLKTVSAALGLYPTYEDFMAALIAGTFPIDLNGINIDGWTQQGTALNKANLFSDSTASVLGLTASNTPNDALAKLKTLIDGAIDYANTKTQSTVISYVGTGTNSEEGACSITAPFPIKCALVLYRLDTNGRQNNQDFFSSVSMDDLTTNYTQYKGLCWDTQGAYDVYAKRSADYKTLSWYNSSSVDQQLNTLGYIYKILVIGG